MFEGMLQTLTDLEREEIQMPALEYAYSLLLFYLVRWLEGEQFCFFTFMSQRSEEIHTKWLRMVEKHMGKDLVLVTWII